ncbi:hypothetical protein LTR09_006379 [Extremus antarcticus]|uniref:Uncharacterized protein n=1 Tax=Extremus antarcticus TaxID=702011 RepID=A0AAJ0DEG0_9PEZI|nr:hypothetical protein LTR09_006379 [Extremus antarcticus]
MGPFKDKVTDILVDNEDERRGARRQYEERLQDSTNRPDDTLHWRQLEHGAEYVARNNAQADRRVYGVDGADESRDEDEAEHGDVTSHTSVTDESGHVEDEHGRENCTREEGRAHQQPVTFIEPAPLNEERLTPIQTPEPGYEIGEAGVAGAAVARPMGGAGIFFERTEPAAGPSTDNVTKYDEERELLWNKKAKRPAMQHRTPSGQLRELRRSERELLVQSTKHTHEHSHEVSESVRGPTNWPLLDRPSIDNGTASGEEAENAIRRHQTLSVEAVSAHEPNIGEAMAQLLSGISSAEHPASGAENTEPVAEATDRFLDEAVKNAQPTEPLPGFDRSTAPGDEGLLTPVNTREDGREMPDRDRIVRRRSYVVEEKAGRLSAAARAAAFDTYRKTGIWLDKDPQTPAPGTIRQQPGRQLSPGARAAAAGGYRRSGAGPRRRAQSADPCTSRRPHTSSPRNNSETTRWGTSGVVGFRSGDGAGCCEWNPLGSGDLWCPDNTVNPGLFGRPRATRRTGYNGYWGIANTPVMDLWGYPRPAQLSPWPGLRPWAGARVVQPWRRPYWHLYELDPGNYYHRRFEVAQKARRAEDDPLRSRNLPAGSEDGAARDSSTPAKPASDLGKSKRRGLNPTHRSFGSRDTRDPFADPRTEDRGKPMPPGWDPLGNRNPEELFRQGVKSLVRKTGEKLHLGGRSNPSTQGGPNTKETSKPPVNGASHGTRRAPGGKTDEAQRNGTSDSPLGKDSRKLFKKQPVTDTGDGPPTTPGADTTQDDETAGWLPHAASPDRPHSEPEVDPPIMPGAATAEETREAEEAQGWRRRATPTRRSHHDAGGESEGPYKRPPLPRRPRTPERSQTPGSKRTPPEQRARIAPRSNRPTYPSPIHKQPGTLRNDTRALLKAMGIMKKTEKEQDEARRKKVENVKKGKHGNRVPKEAKRGGDVDGDTEDEKSEDDESKGSDSKLLPKEEGEGSDGEKDARGVL